jgi:hypothetical protein
MLCVHRTDQILTTRQAWQCTCLAVCNPQNPTSQCASAGKTCTQVQSFACRSDGENPNSALRKVRRQYSDRSARGSAKTGDMSPTWENAPACILSAGRFDERMIGVEPFFAGHCRSARLYQRRDIAGSQQSVGFRELGVHAVAPCKTVHCSGATDDLAASDKAVRITHTMATPGAACPLRRLLARPGAPRGPPAALRP